MSSFFASLFNSHLDNPSDGALASGTEKKSLRYFEISTWLIAFGIAYVAQDLTFAVVMLVSFLLRELIRAAYAKKKHGLQLALPFLVPLPFTAGMMGTVSYAPTNKGISKQALFESACVGSMALFVIGMIVSVLGTSSSQAAELSEGYHMMFQPSLFENTLMRSFFQKTTYIEWSSISRAGHALLALACWNLIPFGQSDGGYISQALSPAKSWIPPVVFSILLAVLALVFHPIWWMVLVLFLLVASKRPQLDENSPSVSRPLLWLSIVLVLAAINFSFVPFDYKLVVLAP